MEVGSSGRVRLQDFYSGGLDNSTWQFAESLPYLRELGALDETDAARPTVIIPNYLNSPANCVASSKFYSVCCIDECEDLLGSLEKQIAAPEAMPAQILELVSALPSDTMQAPRQLSENLKQRLQDIAEHHNGRVPLHGRLFAQWMHHAYPRECQYPHLAGTTKPVSQEEWLEQNNNEPIMAGEADIRALLGNSKAASVQEVAKEPKQTEELPWLQSEELFVSRPELPASSGALSFISKLTVALS